jgi:hypothetical protein
MKNIKDDIAKFIGFTRTNPKIQIWRMSFYPPCSYCQTRTHINNSLHLHSTYVLGNLHLTGGLVHYTLFIFLNSINCVPKYWNLKANMITNGHFDKLSAIKERLRAIEGTYLYKNRWNVPGSKHRGPQKVQSVRIC